MSGVLYVVAKDFHPKVHNRVKMVVWEYERETDKTYRRAESCPDTYALVVGKDTVESPSGLFSLTRDEAVNAFASKCRTEAAALRRQAFALDHQASGALALVTP